jgi:hypothetical protein
VTLPPDGYVHVCDVGSVTYEWDDRACKEAAEHQVSGADADILRGERSRKAADLCPDGVHSLRSDTRLPRGMSRLARRMAFPGMAGWRRRAGLAVAAAALLFGAVSSCGSAAGYDRGRGATSVLVGHQPLWRHRLASGWAYLIGQRGSAR